MRGQFKIFSCNSNPLLVQRVCSALEIAPGKALVGRFSDGEIRVELHENVRGMDIYIVQSTCPPVNDMLFELLIMIDALKRASALRINAVIPYYGYGRQDQKNKPRVSISAKVVADLLISAGADRIIAADLHADQIEGFFDIPVDNIWVTEVLLGEARRSLRGDEIIVAPDAGGVPRTRSFAKRLNIDLAIMDHRGTITEPASRIVGNVRGKRVIILDDMVDTGRTLARAADAAKAAGADIIDAYCVHALLSRSAGEMLERSALRSLIVTDTVPLVPEVATLPKIRTVSIAPMLAEAIRRIHSEDSVSSLFER